MAFRKRRKRDVLEEYENNEATGVELDPDADAQDVSSPYDPKLIRVDPKVYSIRQILDMIDESELDLTPEFQRRRVWKPRQKSEVRLIADEASALEFYRYEPEIRNYPEDVFIQVAGTLYPKLHFVNGISQQIRRFSEPYRSTMRVKLIKAFSDLNDLLPDVLKEHAQPHAIVAAFSARSEFRISPESPKTRKNAAAMKRRDVEFGSDTIRCEWHLKFNPTKDRIHFYFGKQKIAIGKILVGIFCRHLPI